MESIVSSERPSGKRDSGKRSSAVDALDALRSRRARKLRKLGRVTVIDLDARRLRIVEATTDRGRTKVQRLLSIDLPNEDELDSNDLNALGKWIGATLRENRVRAKDVVVGLPRREAIFKPLTLPPAENYGELASMVHFQVGKDLPFPPEEAVIDFALENAETPDANVSTSSVLAVAVRRSSVKKYEAELAAAGLELRALALRSLANLSCLRGTGAIDDRSGAIAFVQLRETEAVIDVFSAGALAFSRVASAPTSDAVAIEIERSLHTFAGTPGRGDVAKVLIAGSRGDEESVRETLEKRVDVPVEIFDPTRALELDDDQAPLARDSVAALGLALSVLERRGLPFDFVDPKRVPVERSSSLRRKILGAAGAVLFLVSGVIVRDKILTQKREPHSGLESKIASYTSHASSYAAVRRAEATVRQWSASAPRWVDHWAYLSAILPSSTEVYVTSLTTTGTGNLLVTIKAKDGTRLARFHRQLRSAGYGVPATTISPVKDKLGYTYQTTYELRVPPGMAPDLAGHQPPDRPKDDASLDGVSIQEGGS